MKSSTIGALKALYLHVLVIFAIGLGVRLAYWSDARAYSIGADEPDYVLPAQTLLRDGHYVDTFITPGRTWTRVPLTSLVFAASFLFVNDGAARGAVGDDATLMQPRYDALNMAQIAESLVTVALMMLLTARIFPTRSKRAVLLTGYIGALYPPLASSPAQRALSEPTSIMLIMAAIYALSMWSPHGSLRKAVAVAAVSGGLLGVGALARPIALMFLPFAIVWMFICYISWQRASAVGIIKQIQTSASEPEQAKSGLIRRFHRPITCGLVATVMCFLAISPWTLYNYRHYGRFLLLDTASATAYWNYHNYRGEDITARMSALPNPADRLSLIVKEGTANILEYPERAISGVVFSFFYFWHMESNSAVLLNPWDMTQRDPDVPDLLHSDAAFLLVGLAGVCGLVGVGLRRPSDRAGRTLLLLNLWLLSMVLLGLLVPYDGRYRLPAAPAFIILAAGLFATTEWRAVFSPRRALLLLRHYPRVAIGAMALCLWVLAGAYSPNIPPLLRCLYQSWRGDIALVTGSFSNGPDYVNSGAPTALARYKLAQQAFPGFFYPYRREAEVAAANRLDDLARQQYETSRRLAPDDPYSILGFADLANRHADWKLTGDERKWVLRDESDWLGNPWNSFHPSTLRDERLDIGSGRDIGYIRGFYAPDQPSSSFNYRWSRGRSTVRIPASGTAPYKFAKLRLSAPGIGPNDPMAVRIEAEGEGTTLNVAPGWADYTIKLPTEKQTTGQVITLEITSPTRKVSQYMPNSNDPRSLGVGIDSISLQH